MTAKQPKEVRLRQILDAAVAVFLENGYERASMEKIAARSGLTKGGLYHHFKGKDDILLEATRRFAEPVTEIMGKTASRTSAEKALRGLIRQYLGYWDSHRTELAFYFLSMVKAVRLPHLAKLYEGYGLQVVAFYRGIFENGFRSGEFRRHDAEVRATALASALDGAAGILLVDPQSNLRSFTAALEQCFVDDILIKKKAGGRP